MSTISRRPRKRSKRKLAAEIAHAKKHAASLHEELVNVGAIVNALLVAIERVVNQQRVERFGRERSRRRRTRNGSAS